MVGRFRPALPWRWCVQDWGEPLSLLPRSLEPFSAESQNQIAFAGPCEVGEIDEAMGDRDEAPTECFAVPVLGGSVRRERREAKLEKVVLGMRPQPAEHL